MAFVTFEITFDFIDRQLRIEKATAHDEQSAEAAFGRGLLSRGNGTLSDLKLPVSINMMPNEIENPIAFDRDQGHPLLRPRICKTVLARSRAK
jgi:hypothetical protein